MATPAFFGPELHVNTTSVDDQDEPSITALANGKFVAVWEDSSNAGGDTDFTAVRGQLFNADGSKAGGEFLVNQTIAGFQGNPAVTALADGRFVVAWDHDNINEVTGVVDVGVRARIFNVDGNPASNELKVSTQTDKSTDGPAIAARPGGGFLVTWTHVFSAADDDIHARAFDSVGKALSDEFAVDITGSTDEAESAVVGLANGNYVVVWTDDGSAGETDGSGSHIRGKILSADGSTVLDEFIVNSTATSNQEEPAIALLSNGNFVVTWTSHDGMSGEQGIRGRMFSPTGTALGADFLVENDAELEGNPAVSALANGQYVVAWQNDTGLTETDGSKGHIRGNIFVDAGSISSGEFIVNTTTNLDQRDVKLTTLADGRFVAIWNDNGGNLGDELRGVRAQIFDQRTQAVNLTGAALNDDWVGTRFNDAMNGNGGDDRIAGGAGTDFLNGGAGADTIFGDGGTDLLFGDSGDDRLAGGEGNDLLNGFTGVDRMAGGTGDDTFLVEQKGDLVIENAGGGIDRVVSTVSFVLAANVEALEIDVDAKGSINATGNALANELTGNGGNNTLDGKAGADKMSGGLGNDTYVVDNAGDKVVERAGEGVDTIVSSIAFVLGVEVENLKLTGTGDPVAKASAGGINGTGNALGNVITGNDGANILDGGIGNDTLGGKAGRDTLLGGIGDDQISGGRGKDKLTGGDGSDSFLFDEALVRGNADKIADFKKKADTFLLDDAVFDGLGLGELKKKAYFEGDAAHDRNDRIILTDKGKLLFDADGKGGERAVMFAKVGKDVDLSHNDFIVI